MLKADPPASGRLKPNPLDAGIRRRGEETVENLGCEIEASRDITSQVLL